MSDRALSGGVIIRCQLSHLNHCHSSARCWHSRDCQEARSSGTPRSSPFPWSQVVPRSWMIRIPLLSPERAMVTARASAGGCPDPSGGCCGSPTSWSWTDRPRSSACRQDCGDHFCPDRVSAASQWTSWWSKEGGHWATGAWLDLVCILPKNLPGDLPWSAPKYASLVTISLLPEIYFWLSAMKNTCFKQIKWTSESSSNFTINKAVFLCIARHSLRIVKRCGSCINNCHDRAPVLYLHL